MRGVAVMYRRFAARMKSAVVHLDEVAFVFAIERGAGGAVRFVADDEVEVGEPYVCCAWLTTSMDW